MKILIACEFTGVVREAFRAMGHDAWSCDLLDSEIPSSCHIKDDVMRVIDDGWDMMIAHPPCTHICVSGNRYYANTQERANAVNFVERLWLCEIPRVCIENPIGVLSTASVLGKPTQYIQPYEYGHPESKRTCLWLRELPPLIPTNILHLPDSGRWENQTPSGQNKLGPSPTRSQERSRTYQGWADAMAMQWGIL